MKKVESIAQLLQFQSDVRAKRKGFLTNFYYDEFKHGVWIKNGDFFYLQNNDTTFLIRTSNTFCNVFYISTSIDDIKQGMPLLQQEINTSLIFDIVGRSEQCFPVVEVFKSMGFKEATSLVRMVRNTSIIKEDDTFCKVSIAEERHVYEVSKLLHQYFVDKIEQIPYIEELMAYAKLGHIHVYLENDHVIGFMIFEKNASTLYWRYWFVHPDYRERHIGSILFHRLFFEANETKRQLLWVLRTNENAKKRQEHYGFKEENMFDYIMEFNKQD